MSAPRLPSTRRPAGRNQEWGSKLDKVYYDASEPKDVDTDFERDRANESEKELKKVACHMASMKRKHSEITKDQKRRT